MVTDRNRRKAMTALKMTKNWGARCKQAGVGSVGREKGAMICACVDAVRVPAPRDERAHGRHLRK
jgi:hypothetical protein